MENRTPAFVDKVCQLLPPPPCVSFEFPDGKPRVVIREAEEEEDALGWALRRRFGDHGDDSIYRGMFLFNRPESDAVDAAWKAAPLVFHDKRLVDTADIRLPRHLIPTPLDFTKTIDAILRRHPGPVKFFGVDRSACPGPELLVDWIYVLAEKNVECLRFVNLSKSQELEFPLHRLRGDDTLKSLAIAFFNISRPLRLTLDEYPEATFGALSNLTLGCCALDGQALASLILDCHVLTTVKIVGSNLTAGHGARGLSIISYSVNRLEFQRCSAITALTLDTPALQFLTLQVNPGMDSERPGVKIHLDSSEYLREITSLMLDRQHFSFSSNSYVMVLVLFIHSNYL